MKFSHVTLGLIGAHWLRTVLTLLGPGYNLVEDGVNTIRPGYNLVEDGVNTIRPGL